jgi:hypothetical protein
MYNPEILHQDLLRVRQEPQRMTNELKVAKRQMGVRFLIEATKSQSLTDVEKAFHKINPSFLVEPLFPKDIFTPVSKDFPLPFPLYESGYVATLQGVEPDDLNLNVFHLAYWALEIGKFISVTPDCPAPNPMQPTAESHEMTQSPSLSSAASLSSAPSPSPSSENHAWSLEAMKIRQAWKANGGNRGKGILIGHTDTGWSAHDKWNQGGMDKTKQRNFLPNETPDDASDRFIQGRFNQPGHGTWTASVITFAGDIRPDGGDTIPSKQVTGVAPDAKHVPLRCVTSVILMPGAKELTQAVTYAVQTGCQVISISLGGLPNSLGKTLEDAIDYAVRKNCIVVAASGNYNIYTAEPARWPNTIAVAGSTYRDEPWLVSAVYPRGSVDIAAPAENVWIGAAVPRGAPANKFEQGKGTSYATAALAGIAALWFTRHFPKGYTGAIPALYAFRQHLKRTARIPQKWDPLYGQGIVDAEKLMTTKPITTLKRPQDCHVELHRDI